MNFPEQEQDLYDRIAKKIKKEARQLRGIEAPRVVVLDVAGVAPDALKLQMDQLRGEVQKLESPRTASRPARVLAALTSPQKDNVS